MYLLKCSKRATNIAVLGELGRYPLLIEVFFTVIKYLKRLKFTEDVLLKEAFNVSKTVNSNNKNSWFYNVNRLLEYFEIDINLFEKSKFDLKQYILRRLKGKYEVLWNSELNDIRENKNYGNKLRTYNKFKRNISFEKYLTILKKKKKKKMRDRNQ